MTRQDYREKLYNKLKCVNGFVDVEVKLKGVGEDREYDTIVYVTNKVNASKVCNLVGTVTFKMVNELEQV